MRYQSTLAILLPLVACSAPQPTPPPPPTPPPQQQQPLQPSVESPSSPTWTYLRARYDADGDGRITRAEYPRSELSFRHLDADKDGVVTAADFDAKWDGVPRVEHFEYGVGGPELGDAAPDFHLKTTEGKELTLAALHAKKPLVLVFGSFT